MSMFSSGSSNMISSFLGGGGGSSSFSSPSSYSSTFSSAANYRPSYSSGYSTPTFSAQSQGGMGGLQVGGSMSAIMMGLGSYVPKMTSGGGWASDEGRNYYNQFKSALNPSSMDYGKLPRMPNENWNDYMKRQETFLDMYSTGPGIASPRNAMNAFLGRKDGGGSQRRASAPMIMGGGRMPMVQPTPGVEFSFGPPPQMKPLEIDYNKFKDVLLQTQLDPSKVKELSSQYNMSGEDFQKLVASYNPTEAQIGGAISLINDPARLNALAEALNRPYREAFSRAMPMYEENMGLANALAGQYLRGQISSDVEGAVTRNAAVQRMQTGLFGQGGLGRNIVPRDLGLTSLDMQARGANLLAQTGQLATQVLQATMPVSGREFVVSPTSIYESMRVSPTALLNATYIPASQIFSAYTVPASQVFDTYVSQAQYNQQIVNQNLLNAWQGQTLPGQYVPGKGFLNFDGSTYSQTRPTLPGTSLTNWMGMRA